MHLSGGCTIVLLVPRIIIELSIKVVPLILLLLLHILHILHILLHNHAAASHDTPHPLLVILITQIPILVLVLLPPPRDTFGTAHFFLSDVSLAVGSQQLIRPLRGSRPGDDGSHGTAGVFALARDWSDAGGDAFLGSGGGRRGRGSSGGEVAFELFEAFNVVHALLDQLC